MGWNFDYMQKPTKRLFIGESWAPKELKLVPYGTVMAIKAEAKVPNAMLRVALPTPDSKSKDITVFIQGRTHNTPLEECEDGTRVFKPTENGEPYVVPYWYVNSSPDMKQVNMELSKIDCGVGHLPIYRNTKPLQKGDELLIYKAVTAIVPAAFKRKSECEAEAASSGGKSSRKKKT